MPLGALYPDMVARQIRPAALCYGHGEAIFWPLRGAMGGHALGGAAGVLLLLSDKDVRYMLQLSQSTEPASHWVGGRVCRSNFPWEKLYNFGLA